MKKGVWAVLSVIVLTTVACSSSRKADYLYSDDAYYGMSDARRDYNKEQRAQQQQQPADDAQAQSNAYDNSQSGNAYQSGATNNSYNYNNGSQSGYGGGTGSYITNNYYSGGSYGYNGYNPYSYTSWSQPGINIIVAPSYGYGYGGYGYGGYGYNSPWGYNSFYRPWYSNYYWGYSGYNPYAYNPWGNPFYGGYYGGGFGGGYYGNPYCYGGGYGGGYYGGGYYGGGYYGNPYNNYNTYNPGNGWTSSQGTYWGKRGDGSATSVGINANNPHVVGTLYKKEGGSRGNSVDPTTTQRAGSTTTATGRVGNEVRNPSVTTDAATGRQAVTPSNNYSGRVRTPETQTQTNEPISRPNYNNMSTTPVNRQPVTTAPATDHTGGTPQNTNMGTGREGQPQNNNYNSTDRTYQSQPQNTNTGTSGRDGYQPQQQPQQQQPQYQPQRQQEYQPQQQPQQQQPRQYEPQQQQPRQYQPAPSQQPQQYNGGGRSYGGGGGGGGFSMPSGGGGGGGSRGGSGSMPAAGGRR